MAKADWLCAAKIYLTDDTIAANIAFGVPKKDINQSDVEAAAKIANIHDFVIGESPSQYETIIGEGGVKLSGGQRQRLGIARALYKKPKILILDESTSALDGLTEETIMDAIYSLGRQTTIILIAHRLNTLQKCDTIFYFAHGRVSAQGTYEELSSTIPEFKRLAHQSTART